MTTTKRILRFRYETAAARAAKAWEQFYLDNDGFYHEQRERARAARGAVFATYRLANNRQMPVWMTPEDLDRHAIVLGATGTGKSSLLERMARLCFDTKRGIALLDPHGDLYARTAAWAKHAGVSDLTLLDFTEPDQLPGWNPLKPLPGVDPGRQVDLLVGIFKRLYSDEDAKSWSYGVKAEEILRYSLRACIESETPATIDTMRSFLLIPALRASLLQTTTAEVRYYFHERFSKREEMHVSAVLNKLEPFLGSMAVQRFLGKPTSTVDPLAIMDRGGTLLVNLAKGYLGPTADILGRLLLNGLELGALRREAIAPDMRLPYTLIIDEAHTFAGSDGALDVLLTAARKYRVSLVLAAQALALFPSRFETLALGNAGHHFFFRLSQQEAHKVAPGLFEPQGNVPRIPVRAYDKLSDPYLTPAEEMRERARELADLPIGACYWMIKGRPYRGRRMQIQPPEEPSPVHPPSP